MASLRSLPCRRFPAPPHRKDRPAGNPALRAAPSVRPALLLLLLAAASVVVAAELPAGAADDDKPPVSAAVQEPPVDDGKTSGGENSGAGEPQWIELFDGKTLDGWVQRGGRAKFFVQRGELVGATRLGTADSFLCTEAEYGDFELQLEFKIDPRVNAGVQFRSRVDPSYEGGVVYGYQAEIDPSERGWTGGIFDQSRRGWLLSLEKQPDARAAFRPDQWNTLRIVARGPAIATWINGVSAAELHDDQTASGFIALQVHRTDLAESREVRWRNIRLRLLK